MSVSNQHVSKVESKSDPKSVDFHVQVILPRCVSTPCKCPVSDQRKRASGPQSSTASASDPVSVPLTRAVVTNSVSCLNQRASASFTVHHDPHSAKVDAKLLTSTSSVGDTEVRLTADAIQQPDLPKLRSTETANSDSSRDTVIERKIEPVQDIPSANPPHPSTTPDEAGITEKAREFKTDQTNIVDKIFSSPDKPVTNVQPENVSRFEPTTNGLKSTEGYVNTLMDSVERPLESPEAAADMIDSVEPLRKSEDPASLITHRSGTPRRQGTETPQSACITPLSRPITPASDRSRSASRAQNTDLQYRAVTVCAAGVALALFLVVMRRLSFMLHGV